MKDMLKCDGTKVEENRVSFEYVYIAFATSVVYYTSILPAIFKLRQKRKYVPR
jgi:hypothetical protein